MSVTADRKPQLGVLRPRADAGNGVAPVGLRRIVVPIDGSPFSERALPIATWAARALGTPLHLVEVVVRRDGSEHASHYLDDLARRHTAASWDVARGDDPAAAIVTVTEAGRPSLICLATHGRDRSASILGSMAMRVLDRTADPVMLVGPNARPPCADDAPVVVAVDGTHHDPAVVRVATQWAVRLRRRLVVATVAEPVPGPFRESRPLHQARGAEDPEAYVEQLATDAAETGCTVDTRVVCDPVSVRDGLVHLVDRTVALLVLGTHRRSRRMRALVGSHAARVVHDIEVPALVVPLDAGG